jgi:hypothetical protein
LELVGREVGGAQPGSQTAWSDRLLPQFVSRCSRRVYDPRRRQFTQDRPDASVGVTDPLELMGREVGGAQPGSQTA